MRTMEHAVSVPRQVEIGNRLLAALTPQEFSLVATDLVHVVLQLGETLHRAGEAVGQVYFPETGLISALSVLPDGQPVEIGLIGAEGVAGVSVILGATAAYSETMCQTAGGAHRISVTALKRALEHLPRLRDMLLRYVHVFHVQVAQTAACNSQHELDERLARWLLAAHDRSGGPHLSLTQDMIAVLLGVRRSTVSVAAGELQRAGIIDYHRGHITIVDRVGLEHAACGCYQTVVDEYRHLMGVDLAVRPGCLPQPANRA